MFIVRHKKDPVITPGRHEYRVWEESVKEQLIHIISALA